MLVILAAGGVWLVTSLLPQSHSTNAITIPAEDPKPVTSAPSVSTSSPVAPPPAPSATAAGCPTRSASSTWSGNTDGGGRGGMEAIKHFDFAYYVTRSGAAARSTVAPDGQVGTAAALQASIDKLAPNTTHCLLITDRGQGLFAVTLAQTTPGTPPELFYQLVQTVDAPDRSVIVSIVPDARKGK